MVRDEEDYKRITNDEFEELRINFLRCANRDVAPLAILKLSAKFNMLIFFLFLFFSRILNYKQKTALSSRLYSWRSCWLWGILCSFSVPRVRVRHRLSKLWTRPTRTKRGSLDKYFIEVVNFEIYPLVLHPNNAYYLVWFLSFFPSISHPIRPPFPLSYKLGKRSAPNVVVWTNFDSLSVFIWINQ